MVQEIKVEGILFDMDGTLVDSTAAVEKAMGDWAQKNGHDKEYFFSHSHGVRTRDNVKPTAAYADIAFETAKVGSIPFRITGDQCTHGKPHPEPFLKGVEKLKGLPGPTIDPSQVLVFEDAPSGLAAGLAAGCQTLAVTTSHTRAQIKSFKSTYKVVDLTRVEVVSVDKESGIITLRVKSLEEDEKEEEAAGVKPVQNGHCE
ncbi:HAD-like protein [Meredithblackwellia eburnea MCA 4105]